MQISNYKGAFLYVSLLLGTTSTAPFSFSSPHPCSFSFAVHSFRPLSPRPFSDSTAKPLEARKFRGQGFGVGARGGGERMRLHSFNVTGISLTAQAGIKEVVGRQRRRLGRERDMSMHRKSVSWYACTCITLVFDCSLP